MTNANLMVILVLVSLLVVGATGLAVKSLVSGIRLDNRVRVAKSTAEKNLKTDLSAAPQLTAAYKDLGNTAPLLSDALPNTADFPSILVTMENIAADAGFVLKSVSPSLAADAADATDTGSASSTSPSTYDFSMSYKGSFTALQKFLANVETSSRPMRITGMQLSGSGSALTGDIDFQTFYQGKSTVPITTETIK